MLHSMENASIHIGNKTIRKQLKIKIVQQHSSVMKFVCIQFDGYPCSCLLFLKSLLHFLSSFSAQVSTWRDSYNQFVSTHTSYKSLPFVNSMRFDIKLCMLVQCVTIYLDLIRTSYYIRALHANFMIIKKLFIIFIINF